MRRWCLLDEAGQLSASSLACCSAAAGVRCKQEKSPGSRARDSPRRRWRGTAPPARAAPAARAPAAACGAGPAAAAPTRAGRGPPTARRPPGTPARWPAPVHCVDGIRHTCGTAPYSHTPLDQHQPGCSLSCTTRPHPLTCTSSSSSSCVISSSSCRCRSPSSPRQRASPASCWQAATRTW
jgi:hypothetical protein